MLNNNKKKSQRKLWKHIVNVTIKRKKVINEFCNNNNSLFVTIFSEWTWTKAKRFKITSISLFSCSYLRKFRKKCMKKVYSLTKTRICMCHHKEVTFIIILMNSCAIYEKKLLLFVHFFSSVTNGMGCFHIILLNFKRKEKKIVK